ncbi:hypothetical protein [Ichthyobacterium seriolicida]|uniref:Uncharacterized protein n=1 Tax=Ichthyobacterium seriolicida TaxID=242600 RepID=A0A1J1E2A0_9FLAO|nr:hypothetical protein [Ichthyobacterium seriolicida]BAV94164.1 hypothetical protein JBKA6_0151 [Ichthyobacterium seriolicida]
MIVPHDAVLEGLKVKAMVSDRASVFPKSGSEVNFDPVNGSDLM